MGKINWHKLGFHRYKNIYRTYNFELKQYTFKYCSCGKWKRNKDPSNATQYPDLAGREQ